MPNFFDQFDAQPSKTNFFDQFDAPASVPSSTASVSKSASSEPQAGNPTSVGYDIAASIPSGIARGAVETTMLPVTANRLTSEAGDYLGDKADHLLRSLFGAPQRTPEDDAKIAAARSTSLSSLLSNVLYGSQDKVRAAMDDTLYQPKTTPGKYAETIGEFAAPGGAPSRATRLADTAGRRAASYLGDILGNAVVPAVSSEAAGQATQGTLLEPVARIIGAILGNVGTTAATAATAPEAVLRRAVGDPNAIDWDAARRLQNNTTGVRLTGPEAITQAAGGATALPNLQRLVEGSTEGRAATAPFFAQRPGQVDTAVGNVLDTIAPQTDTPSVLGPRAADAATNAIRQVEQQRTAAVQPHYTAAATDTVPGDVMANILAHIDGTIDDDWTGILEGPLRELRGRLIAEPATPGQPATRTPVLGPDGQVLHYRSTPAVPGTPEQPITDIENLDRTRKYFRDRMDLPQIGQDVTTKEQNAAVSAALDLLDNAMTNASPNYAAGKQQYADLSRNVVQPVAEGPLGKVAAANTTAGAANALLPQNPMTGSQMEAAELVRRLLGQDADTTQGLVRQAIADRYSRATTETQEGSREFAGAKFRKDIAGNAERNDVLQAILGQLPDQRAATAMPELLDVLQATGRRKPIGSATAFNDAANAELQQPSTLSQAANGVRTLGASFLANAGDAMKKAALRGNIQSLADLFIDPNSVDLIRGAIARGAPNRIPQAAARAASQSVIAASR